MWRDANTTKRPRLTRSAQAVLWAIAAFLLLELALQVRSHLRFGQSVFNLVADQPLYRFDTQHELKLLTPNTQHNGALARITSNAMGLRSPDIPLAKAAGEFRVAIVGASSVMGAYSKTNGHTVSAFLETRLRQAMPNRQVHVINAGIAGATLKAQKSMLHYIAPLAPDRVIFYTGFNDLAGYCRKQNAGDAGASWRPAPLQMPSFLLSTDLLMKNTVFLRRKPPSAVPDLDPETLDTAAFRTDFVDLLDTAESIGFDAVVATVARGYRDTQPLDEQNQLASTALYYLPCFTLQTLYQVHDRHNEILREAAEEKSIPVIELASAIPGGSRYFADASHFTEAGERLAADLLYEAIRGELTDDTNPEDLQ